MGNYRNLVENTKDYFGKKTPMFRELMALKDLPQDVDILTHLRMMYGHTVWGDYIVRLTPEIISHLRERAEDIMVGRELLPKLRSGQVVAIVNSDSMGPVSYNEMMSECSGLELLDLDLAIERAAFWFIEDVMDSAFRMKLFAVYYLLAFRLTLMEDEMDEEQRFAKERLNDLWRKTWATVLFFIGQKLQNRAIEFEKRKDQSLFELTPNQVECYMEDAGLC